MIIVSQDKKTIVNFNAIETIQIDDNVLDKTEAEFEIYANGETLGYYKTEERAKDILLDIAIAYEHMKQLQAHPDRMLGYADKPDFAYEMPQE